MTTAKDFLLSRIGVINTPFDSKFAVPRQARLAAGARGVIVLDDDYSDPNFVLGLEGCTHIWVSFVFHLVGASDKPTVRPPRLGGNERVGVFATRSTHRPNPLGLSVLKLDKVVLGGRTEIHVSGVDLVSGTPILDIKPYVPYVDSVADATYLMADQPPRTLKVVWTDQARNEFELISAKLNLTDMTGVEQILAQDPRPSYHNDEARVYGVSLEGIEFKFTVSENAVTIQGVA
ncbi:tRNA (N6-threonylcarbamoyladenosine(37)-N6)-methyltransferase TrmO [Umboniibacter marinipuniceus]|uniref:tRNA-Thr(GGU) m(6)t(6)A37 methyltransferase TsaA n=1 Tax=Umboniibacter marinipuniceus TaxID=569599 RepID=A0A3M0A9J1_9GAMM|nr:tRNA (N6-threonylcarbamoyladenosine(37)-N6)-methyltransferase TrmO [Umboniibacter marinipuniceus]RMA81286.1 tRNA-Thr(GGU) m(6)t(6)A37 methyltransferase TsaA [Umboniibacter marinipuniceus]